ncbi:MAG: DUF58 domain-containing protein [Thermomicrobiales bacterium]
MTPASPSRTVATHSPTSLYDEATFARLRNLVLQSRRLATIGLAGEHASRRRGLSPEFSDFKPYSPGDDFRRIDWTTYARFDELFVRESDTTIEYDIHLILDTSASMDWTSDDDLPTKLLHAKRIAGAIAWIALWHFDRITLTSLADVAAGRHARGPLQGRSHVIPVFRYIEGLGTVPVPVREPGSSLSDGIFRYVHSRSRPGLLIVLSDALDDEPDDLATAFHRLAARGWETYLLRLEDPAEADPILLFAERDAASQNLELIEGERNSRMQVTGQPRTIEQYLAQRQAWETGIEALDSVSRARVLTIRTHDAIDTTVFTRLRGMGLVR